MLISIDMDRTALREQLALAAKHVVESTRWVKNQQRIVRQLERDGRDTRMARTLLAELERSLELHRQGWALIRAALGADAGSPDDN